MNCRIVLVRTEVAANIGAAARVMRNFDFYDLVLVAPVADPRDLQARALATHGEDVLDRCRAVPDIGEAVADCVLVAGTSARTGGPYRRQSVATAEAVMSHLADAMAAGPVALVFGPERTGLTNEEVSRFTHLIHVPTAPECPALNLAQAVAICLYELRRTLESRRPAVPAEEVASFSDQERMFDALRESLVRIEYLFGPSADALMFGLRHLISRARPSPMEVRLLMGLARQIAWFADKKPPVT
jgi:tRNA/rRNA methyltransferase